MPLTPAEAEELKTAFDMTLVNKERSMETFALYQKSRELFFNTLEKLKEEPRDAQSK